MKNNSDSKDNNPLVSSDFSVEIDEYDLFCESELPKADSDMSIKTDLVSTAKAFNTRIQRKKKEQQEALDNSERSRRIRHQLMLKALISIRKSLKEVSKIDLGSRFSFNLIADDFSSWPRLMIVLTDKNSIEQDLPKFTVTAHDRHDSGTVEIDYSETNKSEKVSLASENDMRGLPIILRKCVRTYLDRIAEIILEAEKNANAIITDDYIEKKKIDEFEEKEETETISSDIYEETFVEDFLESLPTSIGENLIPDSLVPKSQK